MVEVASVMLLTLINTNRMRPPIAPVGLDYVAGAVRRAGATVDVVDLGLAPGPERTLRDYFARHSPQLVGLSLRNVDDCFWPGVAWFVPELAATVCTVRELTDAPVVLGGVGYSIFARQILDVCGADFGIRGDGERSLPALLGELNGRRRFEQVAGLLWRQDGVLRANAPAWPDRLSVPTERDAVDNAAYFRLGGQMGVETKRGCNRHCTYCADPLAKGSVLRLRDPDEVAAEFRSLLDRGIDVFHLCDAEFNLPPDHARAVCDALIRDGLGERMRWYAYLAVIPFDADLAGRMHRAGCAGINFTSDAASLTMLNAYRQPHRPDDLAAAVRWCRQYGIAVMTDLLLGGPGETPETAAESIAFFKQIDPDCVGAALGIRLYPATAVTAQLSADGPLAANPGIHRRYEGPVDLLKPTFYVSPGLGERPAEAIRNFIAGDARFFAPGDDAVPTAESFTGYNYNENRELVEAIAGGARGAYWDILRRRT